MEHRYSERSNAELNVVIYKQNARVALGVITNINDDGIFIESGFAELGANQPIEIEIIARAPLAASEPLSDSGHFFTAGRFPATVVHRTVNGFGAEVEQSSIISSSIAAANRKSANELRISAAR
jgi:hypothetical protein